MLDEWHDILLATSGAAAVLAGLILAAMSVNISAIIKIPSMPSRAGAAIGSLVAVLVATLAALIPSQPLWVLGIETMVAAVGVLALHADASRYQVELRRKIGFRRVAGNVSLSVLQVVPFFVGAILLLTGSVIGLDWIIAAALLVFIGSVVSAWVLLVEILR